MRGGTANCTVVESDRPIGPPVCHPQSVTAMNLPLLDKFEPLGLRYAPRPNGEALADRKGVVMNWRSVARIVLGVASMLLGLLWLLQGVDLLHIPPILCIANCEPVEGGSVGWTTAGVLLLVIGSAAIRAGLRGRGRRA
ncbi:MAG: hypothetical protein ACE148_14855 [Vicinamibacterales bacterium]